MRFKVHMYPTVRVLCKDVEADSMEEAIEAARDDTDLGRLLDHQVGETAVEYDDYSEYFLVDRVLPVDENFRESAWYRNDGKTQFLITKGEENTLAAIADTVGYEKVMDTILSNKELLPLLMNTGNEKLTKRVKERLKDDHDE